MRTARSTTIVLLIAAAALIVAACGDDSSSSSADGGGSGPEVVATTTQVADLTREVAGDRATVDRILEPNSDPHGYEPRPSDVEAIAGADVIVQSGGELDEWLADTIDSSGNDAPTVELIQAVERIDGEEPEGGAHAEEDGHAEGDGHAEEEGHAEDEHAAEEAHDHGDGADPHWWQDPRNAIAAVAAIRDALIAADPSGRADYEANARAYSERLRRLDRAVAACIDAVPAAQRKLVTTHDALAYYAHRYDIDVVGALIPSRSTAAQPSAGDTERLVDQIEREDVAAIFPESSIDPRLERAVARETGAKVGGALWADTLGPEGSDGATYVESIQSNTEKLVDGMTGGEQRCRPEA